MKAFIFCSLQLIIFSMSGQVYFTKDTVAHRMDTAGNYTVPVKGDYWTIATRSFLYEEPQNNDTLVFQNLGKYGTPLFTFHEDGDLDIEYDFSFCGSSYLYFPFVLDKDTIKFPNETYDLPDLLCADFEIETYNDSFLVLTKIRQKPNLYSDLYYKKYFPILDSLPETYKDAVTGNMDIGLEWSGLDDTTWLGMWGTDTLLRVVSPSNNNSTIIYWHIYQNDLSELKRDENLDACGEIIIEVPFKVYGSHNDFILECKPRNCPYICEPFYIIF